jgi:hypothetical protein
MPVRVDSMGFFGLGVACWNVMSELQEFNRPETGGATPLVSALTGRIEAA